MRKNYLILSVLLLIFQLSNAQFCDVRGVVQSAASKNDALPGAYVQLLKENQRVAGLFPNDNGEFIFSSLNSGAYELKASYSGFEDFSISFYLEPGESKYQLIIMHTTAITLDEAKVSGTKKINVGTGGGPPITGKTIIDGPYTNPIDFLALNANITKRGNNFQFSTARPEQTQVIKDNMVQIGPTLPTTLNIGQVRTISAGVPAMYGDFVGGAIEFVTENRLDTLPLRRILVRSSSPFNAYHQNTIETSIYKPIKVSNGFTNWAVTHSFLVQYNKDDNPAYTTLCGITSQQKQALLDQPFTTAAGGINLPSTLQFQSADFEELNAKQNAGNGTIYNSVKLEFKPNSDMWIKLEPSLQLSRRQNWSFSNSLLNAEHNPINTSVVAKLNAQFSHTLKKPFSATGELLYNGDLISKISYLLIADYQRLDNKTVDPLHGDRIFDYGYIGKFASQGNELYDYIEGDFTFTDTNGNVVKTQGYYRWMGYQDTAIQFTAGSQNPFLAAQTAAALRANNLASLSQLAQNQGLLNGQNPAAVNGMWYAPGTIVTNFSKSNTEKSSFSGILDFAVHPSRKLNNQHDMQVGVLFEQRSQSYYSLNANNLWQLMPQLLNNQFTQPDESNPILSYDAKGTFLDTVKFFYINNTDAQTHFDAALRSQVSDDNGYHSGNAHFIDVNTIDPSQLSLNMFSANELWNNGNSYVNYAGYNYLGKLDRRSRQISDFTNDAANRYINAYNPNYTAIWLQDKFILSDVKVRVGLRVERFDANQLVLKDPYSLYPIKNVSEVNELGNKPITHPSNVKEDYAVYVDDMNNPSKVVGYRSGDVWYNEQGIQVQSAEYLRNATTNGVIQPYLTNPNNQQVSSESFQDFQPEIIALPRLSFSFPIQSDALFYAYYDKFAQRPNFAQSFAPINSYYYLENAANIVLPNPALKAARRTDYQFGFKKVLSGNSILNLSAGYAEIVNDINLIRIDQAYPRSYITYGNIDFSTVKSFMAEYQLSLASMDIRANYLLQFADGTGSNVNAAAALIQANQPNLRSLYPLEYDIRHKINFNMSYALDSLAKMWRAKALRNASINVFANAMSGTPYTALLTAIPESQNLGNATRSQIKGNPFGSRMPWNSTFDLSISKIARVGAMSLVIQLNVVNLLNINNIYRVFPYSSLADNDGYLSSPQGQQQIQNELNAQSFVDYYSLKQNNPANYGNPRTISITVRTTF